MMTYTQPLCRLTAGVLSGLTVMLTSCAPTGQATPPPDAVASLPSAQYTMLSGPKKRVAVLPFATKVQASAEAVSPEHLLSLLVRRQPTETPASDTGGIAADMLTTALFKTQHFLVVERDLLDKVLREQGVSTSAAVDPSTAVKVGKILGVQALIVGSVTQLGFHHQRQNVPIVTTHQTLAEAAVDVRAIDTTTAQLLMADTGRGKAQVSGVSVFEYGGGTQADRSKMIGDALRQATEDIARKLVGRLQQVPWTGRVARVTGGSVYLNAGSDLGLTAGMQLDVYRPGEEIIDPVTKQLLGREDMRIGQLQVMDVKDRFAIATSSQGAGVREDDVVRVSSR